MHAELCNGPHRFLAFPRGGPEWSSGSANSLFRLGPSQPLNVQRALHGAQHVRPSRASPAPGEVTGECSAAARATDSRLCLASARGTMAVSSCSIPGVLATESEEAFLERMQLIADSIRSFTRVRVSPAPASGAQCDQQAAPTRGAGAVERVEYRALRSLHSCEERGSEVAARRSKPLAQ